MASWWSILILGSSAHPIGGCIINLEIYSQIALIVSWSLKQELIF